MSFYTFPTFVSFAIPLIAGWGVVAYLFRDIRLPFAFKLSLSYGLGLGVLTQVMLIAGILGVPFDIYTISIPLLLIGFMFLYLSIKTKSDKDKREVFSRDTRESPPFNITLPNIIAALIGLFFLGYVIYQCYYTFWANINYVIEIYDAFSRISFKSKVLYYDRSLSSLSGLPYPSYPLYLPFLQTWSMIVNNGWNDLLLKVTHPFTFFSFLIIQYYFLKYWTNKLWAFGGTVLVLTCSTFIEYSSLGLSTLPILFYNCTTIMLLSMWSKERNHSFLISAALFSGISTFVRIGGLIYLGTHLFFLMHILMADKKFSLKEKAGAAAIFAVPSLGIYSIYSLYKLFIHIPSFSRFSIDFTFSKLLLLPEIINRLLIHFFLNGTWSFIWLLLAVSLICSIGRPLKAEAKPLLSILSLYILLFAASALFTSNDKWLMGADSYDVLLRLTLHFFPLAILLITLINYQLHSEAPKSGQA